MSGGHFDYLQYKIADAYNSIEETINGRELDEDEVEYYIRYRFLDEDEKQYIREHSATMPNREEFSENTLLEFRKAIDLLRKAEVYLQRIDWLLSGDDGEETFHKRLKEDLSKLESSK